MIPIVVFCKRMYNRNIAKEKNGRTKEGSLHVTIQKIRHSKRENGNHRRKDFIKH